MNEDAALTAVGRAIQLSVAPVFLLSAIGAMLSVMTSRVGRVVDRARVVVSLLKESAPDDRGPLQKELASLALRVRLIQRSITFLTLTAILVCSVVATMFIAAFFSARFAAPVAFFFVSAMALFLVGLLYFLREIFIATANVRIGHP
jgi:uncharacterized protein DUF2721